MGFSRFIILFCVLSFWVNSWASSVEIPSIAEVEYPTDSILSANSETDNVLYPRFLDSKLKDKYKNDTDFIYDEAKTKESLLERMSRRFKRWIDGFFGFGNWNIGDILETIYIVVAILVFTGTLYFIITRFFLDGVGIFSKKNKKLDISAKELAENIHEIHFPKTILGYEQEQNYRLAVRYQYLYILKKLTDKKIIDWNPEKTNEDYIKEFDNEGFRKLSYIFDNVWYGEFSINAESYQRFKIQFEEFSVSI